MTNNSPCVVSTLAPTRWPCPAVTLAEHVDDVLTLLDNEHLDRVVLVGHSYSGLIVGQVADRRPEAVLRSVHVASFLPRDGRALLDDWGDDLDMQELERQQVRNGGLLWAPPPHEALADETDLRPRDRDWPSARFVPHPGRTVLDPATMTRPVTEQDVIFVATALLGTDPHADLPPEVTGTMPNRWRLRTLTGGHWPMFSAPNALQAVLEEEAVRA